MKHDLQEHLEYLKKEEKVRSVLLTDPSQADNPIIFASDDFCIQTGYQRSDVVGRNCRFLQGPGTDTATVAQIREAIAHIRPIEVVILNYRADGSPFWNKLQIRPLFDRNGNIEMFAGIQSIVGGRSTSK